MPSVFHISCREMNCFQNLGSHRTRQALGGDAPAPGPLLPHSAVCPPPRAVPLGAAQHVALSGSCSAETMRRPSPRGEPTLGTAARPEEPGLGDGDDRKPLPLWSAAPPALALRACGPRPPASGGVVRAVATGTLVGSFQEICKTAFEEGDAPYRFITASALRTIWRMFVQILYSCCVYHCVDVFPSN